MPDGREGRSSPERMPPGYTNLTTRDGPVVSKSYQGPDAVGRCAREAAVLRALDLSERWQPGGAGTREWLRRLAITESWNEQAPLPH